MPFHRRPVPEVLARDIEADFLYSFVRLQRKGVAERDVLQADVCRILEIPVGVYAEALFEYVSYPRLLGKYEFLRSSVHVLDSKSVGTNEDAGNPYRLQK